MNEMLLMNNIINRTGLSIICLLLVSAGCKKSYEVSEKQEILFQFEFLNYAWNYQHTGYYIDKEGNVLVYNNPENWNYPDENLIISSEKVAENLKQCKKSGIIISKEELKKHSDLIYNISLSKVTALRNVAADAGSYDYICYQYSEDKGEYLGHLIKRDGDFTCENLNFFAKKLALWMNNVYIKTTGK